MSTLTQFVGGSGGGAPLITTNSARSGAQVGDIVFAPISGLLKMPNWLPIDSYSGTGRYLQSAYPELAAVLSTSYRLSPTNLTQRTMYVNSIGNWYRPRLVGFGGGVFVAVCGNSCDLASSTDGITWTNRAGLGNTSGPIGLTYANGAWVMTQTNTSTIYTSTNGTNWDSRAASFSTPWSKAAFGNGVWVVVSRADFTTIAASSADNGVTWTQRTLPTSVHCWRNVQFANGIFVAFGDRGNIYATSTDGVTWTQRTLPFTVNSSGQISTVGSTFYAASSTGQVRSSNDGLSWALTNLSSFPVQVANNILVSNTVNNSSSEGGLMLSKDGEFFKVMHMLTNGSSSYWQDETFAYGAGTYVAGYYTSFSNGNMYTFGIDDTTSFGLPNTPSNAVAPFHLPFIRAKP